MTFLASELRLHVTRLLKQLPISLVIPPPLSHSFMKIPIIALIIIAFAVNGLEAQTNGPDSAVSIEADAAGLSLLPSDQIPTSGTFWFVTSPTNEVSGTTAPYPCLPPSSANDNVYVMANGTFLVDDSAGDAGATADEVLAQVDEVSNLIAQVQSTTTAQPIQSMGVHAMDNSGAPGLTDTNDSDGDYASSAYPSPPPINTNELWLQFTNVADGLAYLNLNNATDTVYAIWGTTNLLTPFANWQVFTEVWPTSETTNILPFTVETDNNTTLFWKAEDWTGVSINGLPAWWTWLYFGNLSKTRQI